MMPLSRACDQQHFSNLSIETDDAMCQVSCSENVWQGLTYCPPFSGFIYICVSEVNFVVRSLQVVTYKIVTDHWLPKQVASLSI